MIRHWVLRFSLLLAAVPASAQIFAPLNQTYTDKKLADLWKRLSIAKPDSNRVFLLLSMTDAYLKANLPDSALTYSDQSAQLALNLGMHEEVLQSRFLACRANCLKDDIGQAGKIAANTTGTWKMRMLQEISEHYSFRPGNLSPNLDTAWRYIQQLVALTDTMHSMAATQNTRAVLGKYYYERGNLARGMECFRQNIREWHQLGNLEQEAHWWSELGIYTPGYAGTIDTILQAVLKARELFDRAGNKKQALFSLSDIAEWHWLMGRFELAEKEQQQVDDQLPLLGQLKMYNQYYRMANYELYLGNHNLALQLILKAKKNMDSVQEDRSAGKLDKCLANIYWLENDIGQSLYWNRVALQEMQGRRDLSIYGPALRIVQGSIIEGDLAGAQQFLAGLERQNLPIRSRDKELIAMAWGNIFETLGEDQKAERFYLDMIRYNTLAKEEAKNDIEQFLDFDLARLSSRYVIGKFYVDRHQFAKAKPYLLMNLVPQTLMPTPADILRDTYLLLFKVDSADGNLASAINHRLLYEKYADSISTDTKARQIAELQIQYETAKKDQDISLLSKQGQLQQVEISRSNLIRNIVLGGLLLTLLISGLLYNQYRLKQRNNKSLQVLVEEKEILLREIHHRVKNNLQMIVSLLGTQSVYLNNEALEAIRDSQNRVFSISLIHQKLYQSENVAFIEMSSYLPELVQYLREIYDVKNQILFHLDIAPLELDISQAVSIGLILNEALTNAIRHAFPVKGRGNAVVIEMVRGDRDIIHLKIADNGVGLPAALDGAMLNSLGIKLMKGLTGDLGGSFSMESQNGTTVYIRFVANVPFENARKIIASAQETTFRV
jgi:two-component sensor histidine kinase